MRVPGVILETADHSVHHKNGSPNLRARGFQEKFRAALNVDSATVVRRGDTLSGIVSRHLHATGRAGDTRALYRGVAEVAHANHLSDPDLIRPGQVIDLSVLEARGHTSKAATATARSRAIAPNRQSHAIAPNRQSHAITPNRQSHAITPNRQSLPWDGLVDGASRLTSGFGPRVHPIHGHQRLHHGIDVAARPGTPIRAMEAGTVIHSGWHGGHGKAVVVRHANGVETLYAHASRTLVRVGDRVSAETPLALVGSTGKSTGPHLHFEVRVQGNPVDPLAYLESRGRYIPSSGKA